VLGQVYSFDGDARERGLTSEEPLQLHQDHSGPAMVQLHIWLSAAL
jgi:hypothetical protein